MVQVGSHQVGFTDSSLRKAMSLNNNSEGRARGGLVPLQLTTLMHVVARCSRIPSC